MIVARSFVDVPGLVQWWGLRTPGAGGGNGGAPPRDEARDDARRKLGDRGRLLFLRQVHGASVVAAPWSDPPDADGALASRAGEAIAIETADCLPVFLVDAEGRRMGAAHAGWRGTALGIVVETIRAIERLGSNPRNLRAALGPCIGPCCYEVGDDVVRAFVRAPADPFFRPGRAGRWFFDLRAANRAQLIACGVSPGRIEDAPCCTKCRPDLFHSYRRDGANAGRMVSVCGWV